MELYGKPIKRHESIVQFSREHHFGLLLIWKIRQGLKANIEPKRIYDYVLFFFDEDLKAHFAEEERVLFPKLNDGDALKQQALSEHTKIYQLIADVKGNNFYPELLPMFADTLEKHIRFEERILFNYLQNKLSEDELVALANEHPVRETNVDVNWDDHFWIPK